MSTPAPSRSGRYLAMLLLGLVIGAIATVMLLRAWEARRDHFPESLMTVMQWHMGQLKANVDGNRCGATDTLPHLQALRAMGNSLEPGFSDLADDSRFKQHASALRASLDGALASPPLNCAGVGSAMKTLGDGCKACHQDFRG